jgi:hypothetical protein
MILLRFETQHCLVLYKAIGLPGGALLTIPVNYGYWFVNA